MQHAASRDAPPCCARRPCSGARPTTRRSAEVIACHRDFAENALGFTALSLLVHFIEQKIKEGEGCRAGAAAAALPAGCPLCAAQLAAAASAHPPSSPPLPTAASVPSRRRMPACDWTTAQRLSWLSQGRSQHQDGGKGQPLLPLLLAAPIRTLSHHLKQRAQCRHAGTPNAAVTRPPLCALRLSQLPGSAPPPP